MVKAHAENPLADSLIGPSLTNVEGQLVVAGSPTEIEGAIRTMVLTREGLRRAGRPHLPVVNAVASAVTAAAHIAGHRYGIRRGDALEIGTVHDAIYAAKVAAGVETEAVLVVQYARPMHYRPNVYAQGDEPAPQVNLVNVQLPGWLGGGAPQFLYLWAPQW